MRGALETVGVCLTRADLVHVLDSIDHANDGNINYGTFLEFAEAQEKADREACDVLRRALAALAERNHSARTVFEEIDKDGSGELDRGEFVRMIRQIGVVDSVDASTVDRLVDLCDIDGNGKISLLEFRRFVDG